MKVSVEAAMKFNAFVTPIVSYRGLFDRTSSAQVIGISVTWGRDNERGYLEWSLQLHLFPFTVMVGNWEDKSER